MPIGGAQAIGRFLDEYGPRGLGLRVAGLCDAAEERDFRRALARAGLGDELTRAEMEELGFYVCDADLEDELIRALGTDAVEAVVDAHGRARLVPNAAEAAGVARPADARAAPALHGQRRQPQDPLRAAAGRGARPGRRYRVRSPACSATSERAQSGRCRRNLERAFEERPAVLAAWVQLNTSIKANMDLRRYELATLAAARRLRSSYCCLAHGSVLIERFDEPVREIALDHREAGLDAIDVAVMDLAERGRRRRDLDRRRRAAAAPRPRPLGDGHHGRGARRGRALLLLEDAGRAGRAAGRDVRRARRRSCARCSSSAGRSPRA